MDIYAQQPRIGRAYDLSTARLDMNNRRSDLARSRFGAPKPSSGRIRLSIFHA